MTRRGFTLLGHEREYEINGTESETGIARVLLESPRGDVTVHGEDSGGIHVTGRTFIRAYNTSDADRANEQSKVRMERQGDLLTISVDASPRANSSSLSADLNISLPKTVQFEMRGRNGDVSVENINGSVSLSTGRGDLKNRPLTAAN